MLIKGDEISMCVCRMLAVLRHISLSPSLYVCVREGRPDEASINNAGLTVFVNAHCFIGRAGFAGINCVDCSQ